MIVRIATEDQYELDDSHKDRLNELDNAVVAAVESGDEEQFHARLGALIALIREQGTVIGDDDLRESEVIVPPADVTLEEAAEDFTGEGLIPG
ncbi:MAG TPA: hypothetical protein VIM22_06800 [Solirubrobacteraceae bacterium]